MPTVSICRRGWMQRTSSSRRLQMQDKVSYNYAVIRVVPHVERGECINCGVIVYCPERRYLGALVHVDKSRLLSLDPAVDVEAVIRYVESIPAICEGKRSAGDVGHFPIAGRFHWLV